MTDHAPLTTDDMPAPDPDRDGPPSDVWPQEFGPEFWDSFREIGLLRLALKDAISQAAILTYRLRDGRPALDLSPVAFSAAFARAIPEEIRDDPGNAALLAGLTAWFADRSSEIVEYRRPRLEPARAARRAREEDEARRLEREANADRLAEDRKWREFERSHPAYAAWKRQQMQPA